MEAISIILLSTISLFSFVINSHGLDLLRGNQTIRDGETIVSANSEFELGFFSPGTSTNRYLGIWYKKKSKGTIVWVANRETPLNNTSGILRMDHREILLFANGSSHIIWSSNSTPRFLKNPVLQLLDNGNLVYRDEEDGNPEIFVWQSFDYPGDTILAGMKFGVNLVTGLEWSYSPWKSVDDPTPSDFVHRINSHGYPQLMLWKGSDVHSRSGPWVGNRFSGNPVQKAVSIYINDFFLNQKEIYYTFHLLNGSSATAATRVLLTPNGESHRFIWNDQNQEWVGYLTLLVSDCDQYGLCGPYGTCNINRSPRCECLRGFNPKFPKKWEAAGWTDGCVRRNQLNCGQRDGFNKFSGVKLPDTRHAWYNLTMNLKECQSMCLKNCTCTAYTNTDIREGGSGCMLWFDGLMDMKDSLEDGQDIYVRMPASELDSIEESKRSRVSRRMLFISAPTVLTAIAAVILLYLFKKRRLSRGGNLNLDEEYLDLPLLNFRRIAGATNNFSLDNKIGEGGFGSVYKGTMGDGQEIAVKRLSEDSRQGIDEFKNEVSCIAKLQHRNLVSLIGCCMEKGERILVYEYMPNKSLDSLIFNEELTKLMDWPKLYNIIIGIARGLLYLHQDSKLKVIHRDLKASNILLDHEMNPKISDFGMARIFGASQIEANTTRVVGTYGYMPPEYAIDGLFSTKSDVYSFGVLVLEIVTGKKNRFFEHPEHNLNLLGHAWRCFNEEHLQKLIDGETFAPGNHSEVFRVIHVALLCVQEYPEDRPNMSSVVLMLNSKNALPDPKRPGFFCERKRQERDRSPSKSVLSSSNKFTITNVAPR